MRKTRSFHSSRFEQPTLIMMLKVGNLRLARDSWYIQSERKYPIRDPGAIEYAFGKGLA